MSRNQIHPRLLTRIREVLAGREEQILDTQMRVYSRLCKARKLLNDSRHPAGLDATAACAAATQALRQLALDGRLGEEQSLREIYDGLDRVSCAICAALEIEPAADRRDLANHTNSVQTEEQPCSNTWATNQMPLR